MLSCHFDSKLLPRGFVGATDSAVPCAQILTIAGRIATSLGKRKVHKVVGLGWRHLATKKKSCNAL